ncbi:hypothetical protein CEXT_699901 [Caerostris extrusa]|uniref:Uncharacterized protein n=1 Tax=Caerostris extrusa TaxID=172846 RepID=A0AAV4T1J0_CAEEX|nr:hypothetical protein CEXT_699901 [Caerostris extrusa]
MTTQSEGEGMGNPKYSFLLPHLTRKERGWRREERDNLWNKKDGVSMANLARCQQGRGRRSMPLPRWPSVRLSGASAGIQRGRILTLHPPIPSFLLVQGSEDPSKATLMKNREMFHKVSDLYPLAIFSIVFLETLPKHPFRSILPSPILLSVLCIFLNRMVVNNSLFSFFFSDTSVHIDSLV